MSLGQDCVVPCAFDRNLQDSRARVTSGSVESKDLRGYAPFDACVVQAGRLCCPCFCVVQSNILRASVKQAGKGATG